MKRWAIVRMGDYEGEGTRVPKLILYPVNVRVWSAPSLEWAVAQFSAVDITDILTDPDIHVLDDLTLDASVSTLPPGQRNKLKSTIEGIGFTVSQGYPNVTYRELLNHVVNQFQTGIDVQTGDVKEINV